MVCPLRTAIVMISVLIASIGLWLTFRESDEDKKSLKLDSLADSDSDSDDDENEEDEQTFGEKSKSFLSFGLSFFNPSEYKRPVLFLGVVVFHLAVFAAMYLLGSAKGLGVGGIAGVSLGFFLWQRSGSSLTSNPQDGITTDKKTK
jgi:hypothetical protein